MTLFGRRDLSLSPILACPVCRQPHIDGSQESGRAIHRCQRLCRRRRLHTRWWAMVLSAGPVEPQLEAVFNGLAPALMRDHRLPDTLREPMFWQLALSAHEAHLHRQTDPVGLFRALQLLRDA